MKTFNLTKQLLLLIISVNAYAGWPEYRGGQHLPGKTDTPVPENIRLAWTFETGGEIKSTPVIQGNRIVLGSTDNKVYCLDLQGNPVWEFQASNAVEAPALIRNNTVYIGDLTGMFYALDLETGRKIWEYEAMNQISAAANWWSDGQREYILVGAYDYYLHAIDARTGKAVWKYEAMNYLHAAVAVTGNYAVFGGCDGLLHVVDIRTGKAATTTEVASYVAGAALLDGTRAYIGDYDGKFSCIDLLPESFAGALNGKADPYPSLVRLLCRVTELLLATATVLFMPWTKIPAKCSGSAIPAAR